MSRVDAGPWSTADTMEPLVSIAMPVRNCAGTLEEAIRSLLNQSFGQWELLIVDDGSTDNTLRVALSFDDPRIKVFADGKNLGLAARLNELIDASRGIYFARMDGDDIAYPQRLEKQVAFLKTHPDVDLLACGALYFQGDGRASGVFIAPSSHEHIAATPWMGFPLPHPSWMGQLRWFRANRYNALARRAQDQELLLRTYKSSRFAALPEILLGYRQEPLRLRKRLLSRWFFSKAIASQAARDGDYLSGTVALAVLVGKTLVDVLLVLAGGENWLRKRRVLLPDDAQLSQWKESWHACQKDG